MRRDLLAVLEASYRLDLETNTWVREIAEAVLPLLDADQKLIAYQYDHTSSSGPKYEGFCTLRMDERDRKAYLALHESVPDEVIPSAYPAVPFARWGRRTFGRTRAGKQMLEALPCGDMMGIGCPSGPKTGLMVTVCSPRSECKTTATSTWVKVAVHLSGAMRLRRALGGSAGGALDLTEGADAVLDPSGAVLHATGDARDARETLRAAASAIDRARGSLRRSDPARALASWRGLVDARWSLVDHFERDGRRFVVARRNEPQFARPRALTRRERHVVALAAAGHPTKVIAYQLGINIASATACLARALTKLGVKSRVELAGIASVLDPWQSSARKKQPSSL